MASDRVHIYFITLFSVMFETILRYVIPIGFGRQYIRWIEGLLGLMAGIATIANNFIAGELYSYLKSIVTIRNSTQI